MTTLVLKETELELNKFYYTCMGENFDTVLWFPIGSPMYKVFSNGDRSITIKSNILTDTGWRVYEVHLHNIGMCTGLHDPIVKALTFTIRFAAEEYKNSITKLQNAQAIASFRKQLIEAAKNGSSI